MENYNLDFSEFEHQEIPVKVRMKDGKVKEYILRQATGSQARKYDNAQSERVVLSDEGEVISFKDVTGLSPFLLSMLLVRKNPRPDESEIVPESEIESWPDEIQQKVFEVAKSISKMNQRTELSELVVELFQHEDCPFSLAEIRKWLKTVSSDRYVRVRALFSETDEEVAKKSQVNTISGSS